MNESKIRNWYKAERIKKRSYNNGTYNGRMNSDNCGCFKAHGWEQPAGQPHC